MKSKSCQICSGKLRLSVLAARDPYSGQTFQIDRCTTCRAGFTRPIPEQLDFYYSDYHGARHGFTAKLCEWRRRRIIEKYHRGSSPPGLIANQSSDEQHAGPALLDVGCGDAGLIRAMTKRGWNADGVDKFAEPASDPNGSDGQEISARVPHRSIGEIQQGKQFDVITAWHVLEHVDDLNGMLNEISERLCDDGVFIAAVPNADSIGARIFRGNWLHLDVPRHLTHFSFASLNRLMADHGFVVSRHRGSEWEYDAMGWIQSFLNAAGAPQNGLLNHLMGKRKDPGRRPASSIFHSVIDPIISISRLLLALGLGVVVAPGIVLMGCLGRGGTLIVVARHHPNRRDPMIQSRHATDIETKE